MAIIVHLIIVLISIGKLFKDTDYKVITVYFSGKKSDIILNDVYSDEILFLEKEPEHLIGSINFVKEKINNILKEKNIEFCISHYFSLTKIIIMYTDLKVVNVIHIPDEYKQKPRIEFINSNSDRISLISVSNSLKLDLEKYYNLEISVLHNSLDIDYLNKYSLSRERSRELLGISKNSFVIGNVARLNKYKDQKTLIRGFYNSLTFLPNDSVLVIIGDGELLDELKNLAKELNINDRILFLGHIYNARIYFNAFDLYICSSIVETLSFATLEAAFANNLIIYSNIDTLIEAIGDNGIPFKANDYIDLSKKIKIAYSNNICKVDIQSFINNYSEYKQKCEFWNFSFIKNMGS